MYSFKGVKNKHIYIQIKEENAAAASYPNPAFLRALMLYKSGWKRTPHVYHLLQRMSL
ncbi:hypothetical protein CHCC20335_0549 [Bacillus paralicheniformis]|nr:hypothetical protein CHCC20335_0549 [Bacillus paralicheniformis]TWN06236.1 hypothetical protein CHCC14566_3419 [Bacillus licheniformis]